MRQRLRVAVPDALINTNTMSGRGRMWHEVVQRLTIPCDVVVVRHGRAERLKRRLGGRPDVWLFDGHSGPMDVREPQVIQLHEAPWSDPDTLATLEPHFMELVIEPSRKAARMAAAIICPSESSRQQIIEDCDVSPDRVFAAHHGVDHSVFHPGVEGGAEVATEHGANAELPYILTVASLHPRKNLLALREAFLQLVREGLPHQLVIVGGPSYGRSDGDEYMAAVTAATPEAPGRIVMVPFGISDQDIAALMCGAAAFCLPSLSEGFGLPGAEAMACGIPVVLSNRAALAEIGRGAAVLVEPYVDEIAGGLRSVLVDPENAKTVGLACARRGRSFTWEACAEGWLAAIRAGARNGK